MSDGDGNEPSEFVENVADSVAESLKGNLDAWVIILSIGAALLITPFPQQLGGPPFTRTVGPSWYVTISYVLMIIATELMVIIALLYSPPWKEGDDA